MQIPAFKKTVNPDSVATSPIVLKPLPPLVAVRISHSRLGFLLYRCSYAVFALSLLPVFSPYIFEQPFWVAGLVLCWFGLGWAYRQQLTGCITGILEFSGGHWQLEHEGRSYRLELAGEVLCWSWLIVLPLRDKASGKTRQLVLFGDALSKDDNARLRRWLRACLTPTA